MLIEVAPAVCPAAPKRFAGGRHACPECGAGVTPTGPRQLFCSQPCRRAWNYRTAVRGQQLLPYALASRQTREGTRGGAEARDAGRYAASEARDLMQRWRDEDAAAGRMAPAAFIALRRRYGHVG